MDSVVRGSNLLATNLHKVLAEKKNNVFFSPFSISSVLTMLLHGLREDTETEVKKVLSYENIDREVLASALEALLSSLDNCPDGYTISYANSLVIDKKFDVLEQYKLDLSKYFKALCVEVDFTNNPGAAKDEINKWVKQKTNGMIRQLLSSLDKSTVLVLLNAVHFKGFWLKRFRKKFISKENFYNHGTTAKRVKMMHQKKSFMFIEKDSFEVLQLPYQGEDIAMLIFLPKSRDGLEEMESLMSPSFISDVIASLREVKVEVALPKFRLEYGEDINETLNQLGIKQIFKTGGDFGGLSESKDLMVTQFIHKAVLEVNEEGCEAVAATSCKLVPLCAPIYEPFHVDHPFAFVIYNMRNELILFMGRVTEL